MTTTKVWQFFITSHDDPSNIPRGFRLIDQYLVERNNGINETFYGFRVHGNGFAIDGYIKFLMGMDKEDVGVLMPGFQLLPFPHYDRDWKLVQTYIKDQSIFTKWRAGITGLTPTILNEVEWQYMEHHELNSF